MKTLNVDLDKLSREGLKAYITLLEELDDYKMKEGFVDDGGVELPLPDFKSETMANPEQQALPDAPNFPAEGSKFPDVKPTPEETKLDEETPSFNV